MDELLTSYENRVIALAHESGIDRFIVAQDETGYSGEPKWAIALDELLEGQKTSHWMWYIFPQAYGLGQSLHSRMYGLLSDDEARGFHKHPDLGLRFRLLESVVGVSLAKGLTLEHIFGDVDAMKYRSSIELRDRVTA